MKRDFFKKIKRFLVFFEKTKKNNSLDLSYMKLINNIMRKSILALVIITTLSTLFASCNKKEKLYYTKKEKVSPVDIPNSKGYKLLESKCYICHFEKPDPSKMRQMIAPPMLRIKEHYLPNYPNKEDFINAVMAIVKNPSEENTLMPGSVRRFKLMPKLIYTDDDLRLIAETIYNMEFGAAPKGRMRAMGLQLNNGKKWFVKQETYEVIQEIVEKLSGFSSDNVADYNQAGKDVFNRAKFVLMDDSYTEELFNQLHNFFYDIEGEIHALITEKDLQNAKKRKENLKTKLQDFYLFFKTK